MPLCSMYGKTISDTAVFCGNCSESSSEVTELPMVKEKGDRYIGGVSDMMGGDIFGSLGLY